MIEHCPASIRYLHTPKNVHVINNMKLSLVFAAVLAASADAAAFQKRQNGNPDGTFDWYRPQATIH
jgi:hypothetical protein